jgi:hypothetical protein
MAIAETSQTRLAIIKESSYGVTPSTPSFRNLRYTGDSLKHNRGNVTSNEIRPDRNVSDLIQVSGGASGGFNFELSYGAFDDLIEAALCGTWTADKVKNGVAKSSFTLEKTYEQGSTDTYIGYTGMVVDGMSLSISSQNIVTGSFTFMGKGGYVDDGIISGATYAESADNDVMSAGLNFSSLAITGAGSPKLTALTLEINNNARIQPVVGSIDSVGVGLGRCVVTGTATIYFEDKDAYELFLAGTASDLTFTLGGSADLQYIFTIPRLKFSDGDVPVAGNDQDITLTLPFQGLYDGTLEATIEIERVEAS